MSRNKEFFIFMSIQFILTCLVTIVCLIVNVRLGLFVLGMQVLMWIAFFYVSSLAIHSNSEAF